MDDNLSLEKRASLKNFFTINRPVKAIIEGSYQSGWNNVYMDAMEFIIPKDTTSIALNDYSNLTRTSIVTSTSEITFIENDEKPIVLDYCPFRGIQRPRGLLIEDGRFFYDIQMFNDQPQHVKNFLSYLEQQYKEGVGFHELHSRIIKNKVQNHVQPYL